MGADDFDADVHGYVEFPVGTALADIEPAEYEMLTLRVDDSFDGLDEFDHVGDDLRMVPEGDDLPDGLDGQVEPVDGVLKERVELSGPAEPVRLTDENGERAIEVIVPTDDGQGVENVALDEFACLRCGAINTGIVRDGSAGLDVQEPHECAGCERQGPFTHSTLDDNALRMAVGAETMWFLPTEIEYAEYGQLWDDVREYIEDYWDAREDEIYAGLTAYALSTWVRENMTFVPHLMLMGKTTGGKTRLLNTLARVSYRATVTASATPASMFRLIDAYDVTFYISEYHGLDPDSQRELDNIVRAGQKRGETVTRAESQAGGGFEPRVFDPFAHVAIATQYEPSDDIINRCIQVRSSSTRRDMPAVLDEDRARGLRDREQYARYRLLDSPEWDRAEAAAYRYLSEQGIKDRPREKLLSLVTMAILWERLDDDFEAFVRRVVQQDDQAAADSKDAMVVRAIRDLAHEQVGETTFFGDVDPYAHIQVLVKDVAEVYNERTGADVSPSWVGHVRSRLDLGRTNTRKGVAIEDPELGTKLRRHCDDLNIKWRPEDDAIESDHQLVEDHIRGKYAPGTTVGPGEVADELDVDLDAAERGFENAAGRGQFIKNADGSFEAT